MGHLQRGDAYFHTLLMHGARAIIARRTYSDWVAGQIARRPYSVVIAAIANKLARTILAVLANGKRYDRAAFAAAI
jgi:transposase